MTIFSRLMLVFLVLTVVTLSPLSGFGCRIVTAELLAAQLDGSCQEEGALDVGTAVSQLNALELNSLGGLLLPLLLLIGLRVTAVTLPVSWTASPELPPPR